MSMWEIVYTIGGAVAASFFLWLASKFEWIGLQFLRNSETAEELDAEYDELTRETRANRRMLRQILYSVNSMVESLNKADDLSEVEVSQIDETTPLSSHEPADD